MAALRRHSTPAVVAASALLAILSVSSPLAGAPSATRQGRKDGAKDPAALHRGSAPTAEKNSAKRSTSRRSDEAEPSGSSTARLAGEKRSGQAGIAGGSPTGGGHPPAVTSQYLRTASRRTLHRLGCGEGRKMRAHGSATDAIAILAFGRPQHRRGGYGASLFGEGFKSTRAIQRAGQAYARGYAECAGDAPPRLEVALGTSNYGTAVSREHGKAWARMVNRSNDWIRANGLHRKVRFAGASDIELGWNGPEVSRRWVRGYDSVAEWRFYNFGDAAGCAPRGDCNGAWTQEDVWFVSWGARSAWPLPQIYTPNGSMAQQWYRLSLYSYHHHGVRMTIVGTLSQRAACRQSSDSCWGIDNPPVRAWRQLQRLLNRDPRTAQPLRWITDLRWQN